jgi:hypothetical protein
MAMMAGDEWCTRGRVFAEGDLVVFNDYGANREDYAPNRHDTVLIVRGNYSHEHWTYVDVELDGNIIVTKLYPKRFDLLERQHYNWKL